MSEAIPSTVLMCHAPIVIPEIAGAEAHRIDATTRSMRDAASHVVERDPDVVVIASPHAPRHPNGWLVATDPEVKGSFARFGRPHIGTGAPFAEQAADRIVRTASEVGLPCEGTPLGELDHGTLVPLWFLAEAGWSGPTVRIALPMSPSHDGCATMGKAIAQAAADNEQRWLVVASGDMSHRLLPDAPAGYDPKAAEFDETVHTHVARGDYPGVRAVDPALRERAAEDVIDTFDIATAAVGDDPSGHRVLSYEGPFGVGYLVAILHAD